MLGLSGKQALGVAVVSLVVLVAYERYQHAGGRVLRTAAG